MGVKLGCWVLGRGVGMPVGFISLTAIVAHERQLFYELLR